MFCFVLRGRRWPGRFGRSSRREVGAKGAAPTGAAGQPAVAARATPAAARGQLSVARGPAASGAAGSLRRHGAGREWQRGQPPVAAQRRLAAAAQRRPVGGTSGPARAAPRLAPASSGTGTRPPAARGTSEYRHSGRPRLVRAGKAQWHAAPAVSGTAGQPAVAPRARQRGGRPAEHPAVGGAARRRRHRRRPAPARRSCRSTRRRRCIVEHRHRRRRRRTRRWAWSRS